MNGPLITGHWTLKPHRRRSGFTLVELLVVIAIISVLIAVLLPALAKARLLADNTVSCSNLRQIGIGMDMYTQQYNGFLPPTDPDYTDWGANGSGWITLLAEGQDALINPDDTTFDRAQGGFVPTTWKKNAFRRDVFWDPTDNVTPTNAPGYGEDPSGDNPIYQRPGFSSYVALSSGMAWPNTGQSFRLVDAPNAGNSYYGIPAHMVVPLLILDISDRYGEVIAPWSDDINYTLQSTNGDGPYYLFNTTPYGNGLRPILFSDFSVEGMGFMAWDDPYDVGTVQYPISVPRDRGMLPG